MEVLQIAWRELSRCAMTRAFRANDTDVRLGKEQYRPTLAAVPSLHLRPRICDIPARVRTENVVT